MRSDNRGGRREGAGRKPGGRAMAMVERAATGHTELVPADFGTRNGENATETRKRAFAAVCARGKTNKEIADILQMSSATVVSWKRQPWFEPMFRAELDRLLGNPLEVFGEMVPKALAAYERELDGGRKASDVGRDVLDRVYGRPVVRDAAASGVTVNIILRSTPAGGVNPYISYDSGADVVDGEAREV